MTPYQPLNQEAKHYHHERCVLGVSNPGVRPSDGKLVISLGPEKHLPGDCKQNKSAENTHIADDAELAEMGSCLALKAHAQWHLGDPPPKSSLLAIAILSR